MLSTGCVNYSVLCSCPQCKDAKCSVYCSTSAEGGGLYDIVGIKENTTSAGDLLDRETRLATYKAAQRGSASKLSVAWGVNFVKSGTVWEDRR